MKIYLHPSSPNCVAVLMTAAELGLSLEAEFVDLSHGAQRDARYRDLNPNAMVPTLVDGDFRLWEANAITQYLASKVPANPLWPQDDRTRADIARWQFWAVAHWLPAVQPFMWENMFKKLQGLGEPDLTALEKATGNLDRFAGVLDSHLRGRDYLVGSTLTLADISVASYLMYAEPAQVPLGHSLEIRRWFGSVQEQTSWDKSMPKKWSEPA